MKQTKSHIISTGIYLVSVLWISIIELIGVTNQIHFLYIIFGDRGYCIHNPKNKIIKLLIVLRLSKVVTQEH